MVTDVLEVLKLVVLVVLVAELGVLVRAIMQSNGNLQKKILEVVEQVIATAIARQDDRIEKRVKRHPETAEGQSNQTVVPRDILGRFSSGDNIPEEVLNGLR